MLFKLHTVTHIYQIMADSLIMAKINYDTLTYLIQTFYSHHDPKFSRQELESSLQVLLLLPIYTNSLCEQLVTCAYDYSMCVCEDLQ